MVCQEAEALLGIQAFVMCKRCIKKRCSLVVTSMDIDISRCGFMLQRFLFIKFMSIFDKDKCIPCNISIVVNQFRG
jgi:hypothetical protein